MEFSGFSACFILQLFGFFGFFLGGKRQVHKSVLWLGVLGTGTGTKLLFRVVFSSAAFECYGTVMYLENGCTQEILLQITLREPRSRMCSAVFTKLDMMAIFHPFLEANVICVSSSLVVPLLLVSSRSKGEATQVLSQLEGEVCLTGRVLRAVVSCLCFCSHWYFLIVTMFSFQLSFLIP